MARAIENLTLGVVNDIGNLKEGAYVSDKLFVSMNSKKFGGQFLVKGQPYRVGEGRVMLITAGHASSVINLEKTDLHEGVLAVVPKGSFFEILDFDEDFNLEAFSYQGFPDETLFLHPAVFDLDTDDWLLCNEYFRLIWHEVNRRQVMLSTVNHLQAALLTDLKALYEKTGKERRLNRQEKILREFIDLVNRYGLKEHGQKFYADRLCITPSHLGFIVKQASGETVMSWINRNIIMHAKAMLKYTDKMVFEISDELNFANPSFFDKFFKRHTGMTPTDYRNILP